MIEEVAIAMGDNNLGKGKIKNKEKEQITRSHRLMREGGYTSHQNVGLHYRVASMDCN